MIITSTEPHERRGRYEAEGSQLADSVWAGVDVGTQSLRVQVLDEGGSVVGQGSARLDSWREAGRHEQDPEQWWQALGAAFGQALTKPTADRLEAVAVCSTSGTFLLADAATRPRTPALMYDDVRAGAEAAEVADVGADIWRRLGYRMQTAWALPKLVWLLRSGPMEVRTEARAGHLAMYHCADFLATRLTGTRVATDWSHALKSGFDLDELAWPGPVLDRFGIPAGLLPEVVRPGTELGRVGTSGAAHTGMRVGTRVIAGLTDGCASQVAVNALVPGAWNSVLGTSLVLKGVTQQRLDDPRGVVYSHRHPDGGWLPGGASSTGAAALELAFAPGDRDALEASAAGHEPSSGLVYPLASRGERFPFDRPEARGFEVGEFVDDGDRYAGVLQGVAFIERLGYSALARLGADLSGPLYLTGGATRSHYWSQLRADILGRLVVLPLHAESAMGAAIVAAAGAGPLAPVAARMSGTGQTLEPRPRNSERLLEAYGRFVDALHERGYIDATFAAYARAQR